MAKLTAREKKELKQGLGNDKLGEKISDDLDEIIEIEDGKILIGDVDGESEEISYNTDMTLLETAITLATEVIVDLDAHAADGADHTAAIDNVNFPLTSGAVTTLASLITLITEIQVDWEAHMADNDLAAGWAFHAAAGTNYSLADLVVPTSVTGSITILNDIKDKLNSHDADAVSHGVGGNHQVAAADAEATLGLSPSAIGTANIADNAVSLAKMAGIARGSIIVGDASGDPAALASGTAGQVVMGDAAGDVISQALTVDINVDGAGQVTIQDNVVTLGKMAGITRGGVIVGDASGDPAELDCSTAGQVVMGDAAGDVISQALTVDINVDGAGQVTIQDNVVTLGKMAGITRGGIIVGDAAGDPAELDCSTAGQVVMGDAAGDVISQGITGDIALTGAGVSTVQIADGSMFMGDANGAAQEFILGDSMNLLESSIYLAEAMRATMDAHAADATEHPTAADATNFPLASPAATDRATLITLIIEMLDEYNDHNDDAVLAGGWAFHDAQVADYAPTSVVAPVTVADCVNRLNDLRTQYNLHQTSAAGHAVGNLYPEAIAAATVSLEGSKYRLWKGRFTIQTDKNDTSASYDIGPVLPDNAIITKCWIDVLTTFAGDGDDSTTIAFTSGEGANDLVNAVAIKTGTPWDTGIQAGIPVGTAATMIKMTAANQPQIVVAVAVTDNLIASGDMICYIEYIISE